MGIFTDEDLYDDRFEYQTSFHYRPNTGPRKKHKQWKNPLLGFWRWFWYWIKEFFLGSR